MEEINKIFNRLREKTFTKKDYKGNMCNEWVDFLSYNDDIQPIKELILSEIETLKAENERLKANARKEILNHYEIKENLITAENHAVMSEKIFDLTGELFDERTARIKKDKENERLKEQLKDTIKLPCKVGDTIYVVPSETNFCLNAMFGHKTDNRIYEQIIESINFYKAGVYIAVTCDGLYTNHSEFLNENWFLTYEEAEEKLKKLKEGK